ncbi:MAG: VanZ family protein [Verrucomicrobiota bacterium]
MMILLLSSIPGGLTNAPSSVGLDFPQIDKLIHFLLYLPLGWTLSLVRMQTVLFCLCILLLPALDEIYQSTVPNRSPDVLDWMADVAGLTCGWFLEKTVKRLKWQHE